MSAVFFDGNDHEAFIRSVELNVKHGLPLTLTERKAAARRILEVSVELSDRVIASKTGLSDKTIAAIRRRAGAELPQANMRIGRDGRTYPVDEVEGRQRAASLIAERPNASLREIASAAEVSPGVVSDVRKRLDGGVGPASRKSQRRRETTNDGASRVPPEIRHVTPSLLTTGSQGKDGQSGDKQMILDRLRSDPSVRGKEAGRNLIRWLSSHAIDIDDLPESANVVPPHRVALGAALARQSADAWLELARRLEDGLGHASRL